MRIDERIVLAGLLAGLLSGCGDAAPARAPVQQTAREAMLRWAQAATPKAACAQLSYGFALFLSDGDARECEAHIQTHIGAVRARPVEVDRVVHRHGQEVVRARVGADSPTDYYFVQRDGALKLNSIGIDIGPNTPAGPQDDPPQPPGATAAPPSR